MSGRGYGTDPNLVTPEAPWPRTLSPRQRLLVETLGDLMLPVRGEHPAPSRAGIADFFDQWVSAPYPSQERDRGLVEAGVAWLDAEAQRRFGAGFAELPPDRRRVVVDAMAPGGPSAAGQPGKFFKRFRYLLVGGYFTSDAGWKAIGYVGNVPRQGFPGVSDDVMRIIEDELRRLGL